MGIGADHEVARLDVTVLHQHQVRDARIDVIELLDAVLARKIARGLLVLGVLLGLGGGNVIEHDGEALGVVELGGADALHDSHGPPGRGMAHHDIRIGVDDFAGRQACRTRLGAKNLFSNRLTHLLLHH